MGIGAVGVASETLGFTNLTAGRGVNIGIVDDDDALLAVTGDETPLSDVSNESLGSSDTFTVEVTNNSENTLDSGDDLAITITVTDDDISGGEDITIEADSEEDFSPSTNEFSSESNDETFDLNKSLTGGGSESATIDFEIVADTDQGNSLTFEFDFDTEFNGTSLQFIRDNIEIEADEDVNSS